MPPSFLARRLDARLLNVSRRSREVRIRMSTTKETLPPPPPETPLIGSGSQEEVDNRVRALLELGTSRGYLTYEELNERLPDEVVSPDKLDSLLMMIDEMGIKLIDEHDIGDFIKGPRNKTASTATTGTAV